jgi:hypothetical protein
MSTGDPLDDLATRLDVSMRTIDEALERRGIVPTSLSRELVIEQVRHWGWPYLRHAVEETARILEKS